MIDHLAEDHHPVELLPPSHPQPQGKFKPSFARRALERVRFAAYFVWLVIEMRKRCISDRYSMLPWFHCFRCVCAFTTILCTLHHD
jgi:hypothetical protein